MNFFEDENGILKMENEYDTKKNMLRKSILRSNFLGIIFREFTKIKLKISEYIRIFIFCRYFGILVLGEIKMKVEIV